MDHKKIFYSVISGETEFGTQYGIQCQENGCPYLSVPAISPDRESIEKLASVCNECELSSNHFLDVVEDFLP